MLPLIITTLLPITNKKLLRCYHQQQLQLDQVISSRGSLMSKQNELWQVQWYMSDRSIDFLDEAVGSLELPLGEFGVGRLPASKQQQIFILLMVEHLDSTALKNILDLAILQNLVGPPPLLLPQIKAVDSVDLNPLGDLRPLLDHILARLLRSVVGINVVEIGSFGLLVEGESHQLVVVESCVQTEPVDQHEVDVLGVLAVVAEGVVHEGAARDAAETLDHVVEEFVEGAEEVGVLAEEQVEVLLEFAPLLGLYAGVEQDLEQLNPLPALRHLFHLDQTLVRSVHEPCERVEMLRTVEDLFWALFDWQVRVFRDLVSQKAQLFLLVLVVLLVLLLNYEHHLLSLNSHPFLHVQYFLRPINLLIKLLLVEMLTQELSLRQTPAQEVDEEVLEEHLASQLLCLGHLERTDVEQHKGVQILADLGVFEGHDHQRVEMSVALVFDVEGLDLGQTAVVAFFGAGTALKAVEDSEEVLLLLESDVVLDLAAILQKLEPFLQLVGKKGSLHLLLLVLLELEPFEIQCLEVVLGGNLVPVLDRMHLLDTFELVDLAADPLPEDLAGLGLSHLEEPLQFLLLLAVPMLVDDVDNPERDDATDQPLPLLVALDVGLVQDLVQKAEGLLQSAHVDVELVPLILGFEEVDLVGVFVAHAEVLALLGPLGHGDPALVSDAFDPLGFAGGLDGVVRRHGHVAGRGPLRVAEIDIPQRFEAASLPPLRLATINDIPQTLHIEFIGRHPCQQIKSFIPGDDVEVVNPDDLEDIGVESLVHHLLDLADQTLLL